VESIFLTIFFLLPHQRGELVEDVQGGADLRILQVATRQGREDDLDLRERQGHGHGVVVVVHVGILHES